MLRLHVLAGALALVIASSPAFAACYQSIGCTDDHYILEGPLWNMGCDELYDVRNMIYKDNGYCFSTDKAIARFGNEGCHISDAARVPLNTYERANVLTIRKIEKAMSCN